jgi:ubiquinone biosynthesis protein
MGTQSAHHRQQAARGPSWPAALASLMRLFVIWWALLQEYRALRLFLAGAGPPDAPARFAARLVSLGPAFVKLGQILSTRPDLLPQAYVDALADLQERGPEIPIDLIRQTIEHELGKPMGELFAAFEQTPAAAASLAQVHRATLFDNTVVAVKVQRPDAEQLIRRDLDAIAAGLRGLSRMFPRRLQRTNFAAFLSEFRRYTLQELHFAGEGRIIDRFRTNFAGRTDIGFPRVHWSHTATRVLTTDWVEGLRLHEAARTLDAPTKDRLVTRLVDVMLQMFIADGLFHADLHPGNIFFHPDGTFTLLDFGMYGELTAAQRDRLILYWLSVVQRQTRRAFHHFKALTRTLPGADQDAFFERFAALAEKFYTSPLSEMSFTRVYIEMMKAGYAFGFVFPSELMLHAKALTTAETIIFVLAPKARFEELSRPFIAREYAARTTSLALLERRASQLLPELVLLGELPPPDAIDVDWDWDATRNVMQEIRDNVEDAVRASLIHGGFWQALLDRHAHEVLRTTRLSLDAGHILKQTWNRYYELEPSIAIQPTVGAVFTTHIAAVVLALHEVLLQHGVAPEESYRLIHDMGWRFYTQMGEPPLLVASAFTRDPRKRLKLATDLFRSFPFGAPGYEWRDVSANDGAIAFDCVKCPVAAFFAEHDASELCVQTFCNLDFPLAEKWGGRLERSGTIASGAPCCDFRWYPPEPAQFRPVGAP